MLRILSFCARLLFTLFCLGLLGGMCFWGYFHYQMHQKHQLEHQQEIQLRQELKAQCHNEHCECFNNIVDYRFNKSQVRAFLRYLQERQNRSEAQLLEFTSISDASEILSILEICQPTPSDDEPVAENVDTQVPTTEPQEVAVN